MNNQHHTSILEANYYLRVYNLHFKLVLSTEQKYSFLIDPIWSLYIFEEWDSLEDFFTKCDMF